VPVGPRLPLRPAARPVVGAPAGPGPPAACRPCAHRAARRGPAQPAHRLHRLQARLPRVRRRRRDRPAGVHLAARRPTRGAHPLLRRGVDRHRAAGGGTLPGRRSHRGGERHPGGPLVPLRRPAPQPLQPGGLRGPLRARPVRVERAGGADRACLGRHLGDAAPAPSTAGHRLPGAHPHRLGHGGGDHRRPGADRQVRTARDRPPGPGGTGELRRRPAPWARGEGHRCGTGAVSRRRRAALISMGGIVAISLAAAGGASASEAGSSVVLVEEMTGAGAVTDTAAQWQVEGTDLGIMWDDGHGGVLTAFGDTFGDWSGDGGGGGDWRSNVLLRSTDTDLTDGMSFDWALEDAPGHAGEIIGSAKVPGEEHTTIPTAGIEIEGRQYLSYMSVREWGDPGQWWTNFAQLVYSDDGGQTWRSDRMPRCETDAHGSSPLQMHAFVRDDGYLYVFGTPNGRFGAAHLARVAEDQVADQSAYEYFTGQGWSADLADVQPVV